MTADTDDDFISTLGSKGVKDRVNNQKNKICVIQHCSTAISTYMTACSP